jgi:general secretion pathway protein D
MTHPTQLRGVRGSLRIGACTLCCLLSAVTGGASWAQAAPASQTPSTADQAPSAANASAPAIAGTAETAVGTPAALKASKRQRRAAENAYLAGAKKLEHDDLDAAEVEFQRALKLDPENRNYAAAISVTREHQLTELVQQAAKARQAGDDGKAETLLSEARKIDPSDPLVLEHSEPVPANNAMTLQPASFAMAKPAVGAGFQQPGPAISDQTRVLSGLDHRMPWQINPPVLAGAVHLKPAEGVKSFDLRGLSTDVIRNVAEAYGIRAVMDDTVDQKNVRFNIENVTYAQAMNALMDMAHVFIVPMDETSVIVAKDEPANRARLERQLQEIINVPGATTEQLNELANIVRNIFDVKQATVQATSGSLLVRAPEDVLLAVNQTVTGLTDSSSEVMVEVKVYEVSTTRSINVGASIPSQFSVFNVNQAANSIVNDNQALVQQAVAQGYISPSASNLDIALALIGLGLVKSNLATNLIGVFGGGVLRTGISASTQTTVNLGLNTTDSRALDDVQIRVGDRQPAIFREGTRYPITTSTYSTGISTAASALSNASINGVSVASLLSQFAGGTTATIPQVSYEDLGITLKATPVIQKTGRINLLLDLKIEALAGGSANGIPVLASRQFASDLTLQDGESAMMVSAVSKTETAALIGVPGLSELPGFQAPTQKTTDRNNTQLVVIVTPHVVRKRSEELVGPRIAVRLKNPG